MDILQRERLLKFGAVPFTTDVIAGELGDYSAVLAKIAALVDEGIGKDVLMTLYDSMVESYAPKSAAERVAVQQEVMQLIALAGLAREGVFT